MLKLKIVKKMLIKINKITDCFKYKVNAVFVLHGNRYFLNKGKRLLEIKLHEVLRLTNLTEQQVNEWNYQHFLYDDKYINPNKTMEAYTEPLTKELKPKVEKKLNKELILDDKSKQEDKAN